MFLFLLFTQDIIVNDLGVMTGVKAGLTRLVIPENVFSLECKLNLIQNTLLNLEIVSSKLKNIPVGYFSNLYKLQIANLEKCIKLKTIPFHCFENCSSLDTIVIPSGVRTIEEYAFFHCKNIKNVSFTKRSTSLLMMRHIFDSNKLTSIDLPSTTRSFLHETFIECKNLADINVVSVSYRSIDGIVFYHNMNCLFFYPPGKNLKSYVFPEITREIAPYAFACQKYLESVVMNNGLTTIYNHAFVGNSKLSHIEIPANVSKIGIYAFADNMNLKSLVIKGNVTIEERAFFKCTNLSSVVFMKGFTQIHANAFQSCNKISDVAAPAIFHKKLKELGFNANILRLPHVRIQIKVIESNESMLFS